MAVKVVIPAHGCSCDGEIKVATGKQRFKCPECGKKVLLGDVFE